MLENRRYPRTSTDAMVEIHHPTMGVFEVKARDLSEGGVFVLTGMYPMPPVGTELMVRIKRYTGAINQEPVKMRVMHQQRDGVGLAFVR
jgi:hypothetical protein